jgi:hypothetical protein
VALLQTLRHYWPGLPQKLKGMPDSRFQPFVTYPKRFLFWWGLLLFLLELGSRRQLDYELRDDETEVLRNVNRVAQTVQTTLPVHKTLEHFVGHVGSEFYRTLCSWMLERPLRMKALDDARLHGCFVVAVDGTGWLCLTERHCPHCLERKVNGKTIYMHQVLEAKLVTPSGMALSMATEFIENPAGEPDQPYASEEERKQDCELKAFARLAPALRVQEPDDTRVLYRWLNGLVHEDTAGRTHHVNALQCDVTRNGKTTHFAWITDVPITARNVQAIATKGGRIRSKIENQGFNVQKNSGFNLEHAYSKNLEVAKAYYYMIQIAHLLMQFLLFGSLLARLARHYGESGVGLYGGLKNIPRRLLDCFRYFVLPEEAFEPPPGMRLRLDTS